MPDDKRFSLHNLNIRSIKQNLKSFRSKYVNFSIIGISETWLNDICNLYNIPDYHLVKKHRTIRSGGGVGIFIFSEIHFSTREDLLHFDDCYESVTVEIDKCVFDTNRSMIIFVLYRPSNTDMRLFNEKLTMFFNTLKSENKLCYIVGDYNINLLSYDVNWYFCMKSSYSFMPLINRPTRITRDSATIIDNIFKNNLTSLEGSLHGILVTDISDNFPVFQVSPIPNRCDTEIKASKRNYSYRNKWAFMEAISETDWSEIYSITDTQAAFTRFYSKFVNLYNKHFQKRRVCTRYNNTKPWLTDCLKQSIHKKNKLYKMHLKIKSVQNDLTYKSYRNKLHHILKFAEKKYYADLLEANKSNLKKTRNILKGMINRNKSSRIQEKFKLNDGSITTDGNIICSHFNDFFINIDPNLANQIKSPNIPTKKYLDDMNKYSTFLEPVTEKEIHDIVKSLKDGDPGHDEITTHIMKFYSHHTCIELTLVHTCNLSLNGGIFPQEMKLASAKPLLNLGNRSYLTITSLCLYSVCCRRSLRRSYTPAF